MDTERMINELENVAEKYRNKRVFTGEVNITAMCEDVIPKLKQLKEYEDLEEQGLMLKLPCSIGSIVYFIPSKSNFRFNKLGHEKNNRVYHQKVARITFTENGWYMECDKDLEYGTGKILVDKFYQETWFLSQAEAEEALERMEKRKSESIEKEEV